MPSPSTSEEARMAVVARKAEAKRADRLAAQEAGGNGGRNDSPDLKLEKKTRELYLAELELHLAEEQAKNSQADAQAALASAERALAIANRALRHYTLKESERLKEAQELKVDKQKFSVQSAKQNLDQMTKDYSNPEQDEFGKATGEIVVWRETVRLALNQRELAGAELLLKGLVDSNIPVKTEQLEGEVLKQQSVLRKAQQALRELAVKDKLSVTRAKNKKVFLELELSEMRERQAAN